jgi:hypothetical protein
VSGRTVRAVVSDELHTDCDISKSRVIERMNVERAILSRNEDVARAIVRRSLQHHVHSCRNSHDQVARPGFESVANESATLGPPRVLDSFAAVARNQVSNPILESLPALIGKREIVGIGTNTKNFLPMRCVRSRCSKSSSGNNNEGERDVTEA